MSDVRQPTPQPVPQQSPPRQPIAVIGLSGRYPGGADDLQQLWRNLVDGVDAITDLPAGRWDSAYAHADHERKGRSYTFAGGYLGAVDGFDAEFFGISPREAQQIDPQQRLLLELAWEALEDAAIAPDTLAGSRTGVFVGLSNRDYADLGDDPGIDAYSNTGQSLSIASNRISYVLDLKGPSFTVDTACSSGMVALHQACLSLAAGECDSALVGAANLLLSPRPYIGFAKASMLSPAGRCKSFDAEGAGYVRAEGGGMLLLKPLAAAELDGDRILGLVIGSGVNSDGRTVGISLPSVTAQAALLAQVYGQAGVTPDDVYYLEAHGTGTSVGDPIECEAIAQVLGGARRSGEPLRVGSIKSNIGHLEPAAGIAGLTKVLLAMKHRQLPANLHFNTPNPRIPFDDWKLQVVARHQPLPQRERPLVFGVNSFGFGGTNGHAVLQEYRPQAAPVQPATQADAAPNPWCELLQLSAASPAALQATARRWLPLLCSADPAGWPALRAAAAHGLGQHAQRLVLQARSPKQACALLEAWLAEPQPGAAPMPVASAKAPAGARPQVAWVYAGNGPQWWGMGRALMATDTTYRTAVQEVDAIFQRLAGWSLIDELARDEASSRMQRTEVAQPTLFALQVGLTTVLRAAGLAPDVVLGHSVGEAAAAWASGALSLEQATQVIHQRSLAQGATAGLGRMAALGVPADEARALIGQIGGFLELAAINSPSSVTVAGDPERLALLCQRLTEAGRFARMLALDYPFHTQAMDGIRAGLAQGLAGLAPGATRVPFLSTVEGRVLDGSALGADYWWRNVREPVAFQAAVDTALGTLQVGAFIEIGPHPVLRDYLLQNAKARGAGSVTVLTTLRRPRAGEEALPDDAGTLGQAVCAAYANGLGEVRALAVRPARTQAMPALPAYPWQRSRHWRGEITLPDLRPAARRVHPLLGWRSSALAPVWENQTDSAALAYLADHVVEDAAIFPGAGYLELGLAAARQLLGEGPLQLEDVDFLKPMVLGGAQPPVLQLAADAIDGSFEIRSRAGLQAADSTLHARGRLTRAEPAHRPAPLAPATLWETLPLDLDAAAHYGGAARRGLRYGPAFQGVLGLRLPADDAEERVAGDRVACAWIELPPACSAGLDGYLSHPALLDACLQLLITLLGRTESRPCAYIPVRVDRLRCFAPLPPQVFCELHLGRDSARSGSASFTVRDASGQCLLILDNTRFHKVDFASASGGAPLRLVERWRPDTTASAGPAAISLPTPERVAAALTVSLPDPGLPTRLDALAGAYASAALRCLHATAGLAADQPFTAGALQRRGQVLPAMASLLRALIDMALADGALQAVPEGLRLGSTPQPDPTPLWLALLRDSPAHAAELQLLAQVGERLPALLRGEQAPARPQDERAHPAFEALLDGAPHRAPAQQLAAAALRRLVAAWPVDRPLRVLELQAGQGGLAATLLPLLPAQRTDYAASDRDPALLERLLQRLGQAAPLRGLVLDLSDDAAWQAQRGAFDLVLCADGLVGAGLVPAEALQRVQALLAPGGWLLLLAPRPQRLATLVFGQDPAWWRQSHHPLQDDAAWARLWPDAGWPQAVPLDAGSHALWLAQAPASGPPLLPTAPSESEPASWLLLVDEQPATAAFAEALSRALVQRGQRVRREAVQCNDTAATAATWLARPTDRVVHLAGLVPGAATADDPLAAQQARLLPLLHLVQALKQDGATLGRPQLLLVTRGATLGPAGDAAAMQPSQSPLWGMARVLCNEHADLAPRLVDLQAPLDASLAQRLADELLADDAETEVLLDATGRWLQRQEASSLVGLAEAAAARPLPAGTGLRLVAAAQGGIDALQLLPVPRRAPGVGEVEVAVRAAGLNFRDVLWAMHLLPEEAVEHGFSGATIGMECAGEVVGVGEGVQGLAAGDRVIGFASGCFASHVTTPAAALARLPAGLGWAEAATIPTTFLTALYALDHLARLQPGERVLIHGAAGGVGLAAVQIAKLRGAVVFGTAGTEEKRRLLRLVGVDHVLDSRSLAFADDVLALTAGQGVDVVLNSLAGEAITKNLQILRPFGRLLEIGKRDFYANSRIGLRPFRNNLSYFGIDADTLLVQRPDLARQVFAEVVQLFADGQLTALPHQALPIGRAAQAFRLMQQSRHVGKIVVTLPAPAEPAPPGLAPGWRADPAGTYLVTGGLGGFGLATAQWLVAQGARALALVSRRGAATEEAQQGLDALAAAGATVQAYAADVGDATALAAVLADVRQTLPPLRGVVHAAMVLDDGPLLGLDAGRLNTVLAPKLRGAWQLHRQTLGDALDCFVLYSSATTVIGNPGQGAYVAANRYLEALVQWRRAQGLPGLAMAWGAIQDVGVLTRHAGVQALLQQRTGMAATPAAQALAELGAMLGAGAGVVSVAQFNLQRLAELLPAARSPRFATLAPQGGGDAAGAGRESLVARLSGLPADARRPLVVETLKEHLARILGTAAGQIDIERPLADMGLDSLMAVELADALERDIGRPVSVMQMIQAASANAVADLVLGATEAAAHV